MMTLNENKHKDEIESFLKIRESNRKKLKD